MKTRILLNWPLQVFFSVNKRLISLFVKLDLTSELFSLSEGKIIIEETDREPYRECQAIYLFCTV